MPTYSIISSAELAGVHGGLSVREALGNAAHNVGEWGRVVYGRQAELNKFAAQPGMSLETYKANLRRFDANYKPITPIENKW